MIPHGGTFGGKHTSSYFHMIPKSKITFNPPQPNYQYIDVPFASAPLDFTNVLTSQMTYKNRTGDLYFKVLTGSGYPTNYSEILTHFDGKKMNIILDDDPTYFYQGRVIVSDWKSMEGVSEFTLSYNLDPYKYPINTSISHDWLWNDLFDNIIYYGIFDVDGSKARNLINPSSTPIVPTIICSASMTVTFNGHTYNLSVGTTTDPGFLLLPGENEMTFTGTGRVQVDYALGKEL